MELPDNHQTIMPYLMVKGGLKFLEFLKNVFEVEILSLSKTDDDLVMNGQVKIGDSTIMFSDSRGDWPPQPAGLFIYVSDADETFKKAISEGALELIKIEEQEYGRSGGVKDPFGNTWWITSLK